MLPTTSPRADTTASTTKRRPLRSCIQSLHRIPDKLWTFFVYLYTFTYAGPLHHYTLKPIELFLLHQEDEQQLRSLLAAFRTSKEQEMQFVQKAALAAAAAVIGTKSWPDIPTSFWLARIFWDISLWCSVCALISSAQQRLLEQLPATDAEAEALGKQALQGLVRIVLRPISCAIFENSAGEDEKLAFERDWTLVWVWQCPTMLMSFSWLYFIVGYALYLLTPIIEERAWDHVRCGALFATVFGAIAGVNFHLNAVITKKTIDKVRQTTESVALIR